MTRALPMSELVGLAVCLVWSHLLSITRLKSHVLLRVGLNLYQAAFIAWFAHGHTRPGVDEPQIERAWWIPLALSLAAVVVLAGACVDLISLYKPAWISRYRYAHVRIVDGVREVEWLDPIVWDGGWWPRLDETGRRHTGQQLW